jgi:hypothetical protein
MVAQSAVATTTNGVDPKAKLNGKAIKSKNQLRRLKAKEKKTAEAGTRSVRGNRLESSFTLTASTNRRRMAHQTLYQP